MTTLTWSGAHEGGFSLDVSAFRLNRGAWSFIVGPSGSGKSMLLRWILGSGEISCNTRSISEWSALDISFVASSTSLPLWLTCWSYFRLESRIRGRQTRKVELEETVESFGLPKECLFERPHELSTGMAQRVEIAMAIAMRTRVLLIDEGTSGIDKQNRDNVLKMIRHKVDDDKLAVVSVSHDINEVSRWADNVFYIDEKCLRVLVWDQQKERENISRGGVNTLLVTAMSGGA